MAKKKSNAKGSKKGGKEKKPRIKVVGDDAQPVAEGIENTTETPSEATEEKKPKARKKKEREDGTMSGLDAAAKVLKEAGISLNAKEMLAKILEQGLWKTDGKTPQATLHAAISREISKKGEASRFRKAERGKFEAVS